MKRNYKVAWSDDLQELVIEVNKLMPEWEPIGGFAVVYRRWTYASGEDDSETTYFQPMVRRQSIVVKPVRGAESG